MFEDSVMVMSALWTTAPLRVKMTHEVVVIEVAEDVVLVDVWRRDQPAVEAPRRASLCDGQRRTAAERSRATVGSSSCT